MVKRYKWLLYLLNCLFVFFAGYFQTQATFLNSLAIYSVVFYMGLIHIPICAAMLYQDVFKVNYNILSRYCSRRSFILSRYTILVRKCVTISIQTVLVPISVLAISFRDAIPMNIVMQIFIRYILLSIFVCLLSFSLLYVVPFLQRKAHYIVLVNLSVLPLISLVKESLNKESSLKYYFNLSVDFEWKVTNVIESLIVNNLPIIVYSVIIGFSLLMFYEQRMEFFVYEKNN